MRLYILSDSLASRPGCMAGVRTRDDIVARTEARARLSLASYVTRMFSDANVIIKVIDIAGPEKN